MDVKDIVIYKIKRLKDGMFSNGMPSPSFNKNGKIWTKLGPLKQHLNLQKSYDWKYDDCEVIAYSGKVTIDHEETIRVKNITSDYTKEATIKRLSGKHE